MAIVSPAPHRSVILKGEDVSTSCCNSYNVTHPFGLTRLLAWDATHIPCHDSPVPFKRSIFSPSPSYTCGNCNDIREPYWSGIAPPPDLNNSLIGQGEAALVTGSNGFDITQPFRR